MERYNVFNLIHKGLRGMLYDTAMSIQHTDMSNAAAADVIGKVKTVLEVFEAHAHHEDEYLLPLLKQSNEALVADFDKDHEIDHQLSEELLELCISWSSAASWAEKSRIGLNIFHAFNEFVAFNLYHMNREENVLLLELWKHYTDADLKKVSAAIVANIPPQILAIESTWMMRSLNVPEIVGWLTEIKNSAPTEVFMHYQEMAKNELQPISYHAVMNELNFTPVNA